MRFPLAFASVVLLAVLQGAATTQGTCSPQTVTRMGGATSSVSRHASVSGDGRYVAFDSNAVDLDGDVVTDVFVYDRLTCVLELISLNTQGVKGDHLSGNPSISDDGRFVAFTSFASLVPDVNAGSDVYVRDRQLGVTILVSERFGGQLSQGDSSQAAISGNGQVVAFVSRVDGLVPGDTNNEADVFVRDLVTGTTERVSVSTEGQQGDSPTFDGVSAPVLSEDGRFVAFLSAMSNLVPNDLNVDIDVFVRDRVMQTTVRASLISSGQETPSLLDSRPAITGDGRFVFFAAFANLVSGDVSCDGIFMRDLMLNVTSCPALDPFNLTPAQNAEQVVVSGDGRYVAFTSFATHYVAGDTGGTDVFVHDRVTGATRRASTSEFGTPATGGSLGDDLDLSEDGQVVAFETAAPNLVPWDPNSGTDVFASVWSAVSSTAGTSLLRNGSFSGGLQHWQAFATPDSSYIVTDTSAGELRFFRIEAPAGTSNQAVVFQQTWAQLLAHAPLEARFQLGNSSTVRKRISVLVHEADFSDLAFCSFWLAPGAPMRSYRMRAHTTKAWSNATISFYAATPGSDGGSYRVDNISLVFDPVVDDDAVDCIDPTAPAAPGGPPSPTLLTNGDFAAGLAPWATFGQITWQITNSVFEFVRPPGTPAGVLLQPTGQALAPNDILTGLVYLGNSSPVRKRVTMILHDSDFSDFSACSFWLPPQLPLSPYFMRTFATQAWANATLSVYPATVGPDEWIRFTDATLQLTPAMTPLGTECLEPGAGSLALVERGLQKRGRR